MNNIRYRIARCDSLVDHLNISTKVICLSVEREDNIGEQISHCITLSGSQQLEKTNEECIDLAFSLMSESIARSVTKLSSINYSVVGSYYIPN
jgi:hypothetical protein